MKKGLLAIGMAYVVQGVWADTVAPVEDINTRSSAAAPVQEATSDSMVSTAAVTPSPSPMLDTSLMTTEQRLTRLENQLNNLTKMNLPQQLSDVQQELQKLSGQLQEQQRDLKTLNDQQRSFYQDLNQRI